VTLHLKTIAKIKDTGVGCAAAQASHSHLNACEKKCLPHMEKKCKGKCDALVVCRATKCS